MSFNDAWNELQKIPNGFAHKAEVEKLIRNKFKGDEEVIKLETLKELAKKYKRKGK